MIRQKDYQWEAAIKVAKEEGDNYVAILLGRLRDAQKEIEALEAAQQSRALDLPSAAVGCRCFVSIESYNKCPVHGTANQ